MPNYCSYAMVVKGKKENVDEFINIIQAGYNYHSDEKPSRHMFRIFEADVIDYEDREVSPEGDAIYRAHIIGDCAWSVHSCMFEGDGTYYSNVSLTTPEEKFNGTTLPVESKRLNLEIEVFSEECGFAFQEHYLISNGEVLQNECVDWYCHDLSDYDTKEEAEADLEVKISDEQWDELRYDEGGFGDWDFSI